MKPIVCLYCEGNDTKLAVVDQDKTLGKIKVLRTASVDVVASGANLGFDPSSGLSLEGEALHFDGETSADLLSEPDSASIGALSGTLQGLNTSTTLFIPAISEPALYYHSFEGKRDVRDSKLIQDLIEDIRETKSVNVERESIDYTELSDGSLLATFVVGEIGCVSLLNSVAQHFGKKYFRIPTIKSADISLAYYVAKRKKFFPDDQSLIVYIGKEYSKLIFLHGRKVKHIGTTLDIGTLNLHTYDVYFSKILLEMENGGISALDNIIVCGEDDSENLILSFYGTFPEANVSKLEFDDLDVSVLDEETRQKFSSYSVPIAVATEYFDELEKETRGINILPRYIREEQKFFQFSWHSFVVMPFLFLAAFLITMKVLQNSKELTDLNSDITRKTIIARQNQEMLGKIANLENKIATFDQTVAILDSASAGSGAFKSVLKEFSDFGARKQGVWLSKLSSDGSKLANIEGYSLSRYTLTDFAYSIQKATLNSMLNESLRDKNAYKFNITFDLSSYPKKNNE
ncbi:MAG: hypothetical protein MUO34_01425 [Ignavibacteriaceae bacterium]|nr:hypothetical protein [Ignavibacteriaceae bacterium]